MALLETLADDFNDNSVNTGLWSISTGSSNTSVQEYNRSIVFSVNDTANFSAVSTYDLTGSYAVMQLVSAGVQASGYRVNLFNLSGDLKNYLWQIHNNQILAIVDDVPGTNPDVTLNTDTYNSSTFLWLRIREASGTVYWDYAGADGSWNNFASTSLGSNDITAVTVLNSVLNSSGSSKTLIIDNFNFLPLKDDFSTLEDDFDDSSIDSDKWITAVSGSGSSITESGGAITLTAVTSGQAILDSRHDYNLVGSAVYLQLSSVGSAHANFLAIISYCVTNLASNDSRYAQLGWEIRNGTLYAALITAGGTGSISAPYNPSVHRWLRIRESGGTSYWDYSTDAITWVNFANATTSGYLLQNMWLSGQNQNTSGSTKSLTLDNFNISVFEPTVVIAGSSSITSSAHVTYYPTVTIEGASTLVAIGVSLADQRQVEKTYLYKVFDTSGNFLGLWNDVISEFTFDQEINSAGSSIQVELGRNSDSKVIDLEELHTTSGENITTQDSQNLIVAAESRNAIGPGSNVDLNYEVEIWVFYGEITELSTSTGELITTESDESILVNYGAVNGLRKFHGYITRYVSRYGNDETVQVSIASFGVELDNYVLENAGNTTVTYSTDDPSDILTAALDLFNAAGGLVSYTSNSISQTSTSATYTFRLNTYLEVLRKCLELAPYDWWFRIGLGDDTVYFRDKPTTVSHLFTLGKEIEELNLEYSIENITNLVYFVGGDVAGTPLYKKYTDATSIANYRQGLQRITDHRVTIEASADLIAEGEMERNSAPRYRTSITILSEVYDTESIELGQLIGFSNFGNYIDDLELQIVGIRYEPDRVTMQLDSLLPSVNKRIEDLRRNLVELDNIELPTAPS